jgi:hypothetical protein
MFSMKRYFRMTVAPRKRSAHLQLESLEDRLAPAVFTPLPSTPDGAALSLRDAVLQANANNDAANMIILAAGTYTLSNAPLGNVVIQDTASGLAAKSLTITNPGTGTAIITGSPNWQDRLFQIVSTSQGSITVTMQNVTLEGGNAQAGGELGGNVALGGGLLIDGGQVTLSNVSLVGNTARGQAGAPGAAGAPGQPGGNGGDGNAAEGGGIFLASGALTISNSTIDYNQALGGQGGQGGGGGKGADGAPGVSGTKGANGANGANGIGIGVVGADGQPGNAGGAGGGGSAGLPGGAGGQGGGAAMAWAAAFTWPPAS